MGVILQISIKIEKRGRVKVRLPLFLFVLLMESGSKYSILKEEKFLLGHSLNYLHFLLDWKVSNSRGLRNSGL